MAKVKYRIREFKPTANQTGGHSVQGCERFDRECNGIVKTKDGRTFKQTTLFEL